MLNTSINLTRFLLFSYAPQGLYIVRNMPLFGKSQKSPAEVVKALKEAVNALERGDKKVEKVCCEAVYRFL